jgi:hypothetical protein
MLSDRKCLSWDILCPQVSALEIRHHANGFPPDGRNKHSFESYLVLVRALFCVLVICH